MGWIIYGIVASIVLLALWNPSAERRRGRAVKLVFRYRMYVEPADVPGFDALLDRERWARCACAATLLAAAAVVFTSPLRGLDSNAHLALTLTVAVVAVWATVVASARPRPGTPWDGPTEPARRSGTADFVDPLVRLGVGCAAIGGLVLALHLWSSLSDDVDVGSVLLALVPVWGFVLSELGARLAAGMPREVHTGRRYAAESMTSETVYWAYGLVFIFDFMSFDQAGFDVLDSTGVVLAIVAIVLIAALTDRRKTRSYLRFRTRLWPHLTEDQVVHTSEKSLPA